MKVLACLVVPRKVTGVNGVVDDGPFPPSSNSRPNVELNTTVPPTVEVSEPIEGQESDSESSR